MGLEKQNWFTAPGNQNIDTEAAKKNLANIGKKKKNGVVDSNLMASGIAGTDWEEIKKKNEDKKQDSGRPWYVSAENHGVDWKAVNEKSNAGALSQDDIEAIEKIMEEQKNRQAEQEEARKEVDSTYEKTAEIGEKEKQKSYRESMQGDIEDINNIYQNIDNNKKPDESDELSKQKAYRESLKGEIDEVNEAYKKAENSGTNNPEQPEAGKEAPKNPEQNAEADKEAKSVERKNRIAELKKEIEDARKEYLEVDYKKNTALRRIRKFFGNFAKEKREENLEDDPEIAMMRAKYDDKLLDLYRLQKAEAMENGASNEELANLFADFRTEQNINLAAEHDKVKIEQQDGKLPGIIGEKMVKFSKWYQELPFAAKIGMAGLVAGSGFLAGGILAGTAAATFLGGAVGFKRLMGGMTTGVGVALGLEARGQKKDKEKIEKEKQEFLKKLENLSEEDKYKLLSDSIENVAIKDEENSINRIKNQDIRQLATGAAVGTFIGSGMMSDLLKWGYGAVAEHFNGGTHVPDKIPVGGEIESHEAVFDQELTIDKGSSIEGRLIELLKEKGVENPGPEAHKMYISYMKDYINTHHDELLKAGKLAEYQQMLADGNVNVAPGTGLHVVADKDGFTLREVHGNMSHFETKIPDVTTTPPDVVSPISTVPEPQPEFKPYVNFPEGKIVSLQDATSGVNSLKELNEHRTYLLGAIEETKSNLEIHERAYREAVGLGNNIDLPETTEAHNLKEHLNLLEKDLSGTEKQMSDIKSSVEEYLENKNVSGNVHETGAVVADQSNAGSPVPEAVKVTGNVHETGAVAEHFNRSHPLEFNSGSKISFDYDENGEIKRVARVSTIVRGDDYTKYLGGQELPKMNRATTTVMQKIVGEFKLYEELKNSGHPKEAGAVLKDIYNNLDKIESKSGSLVDRSKLLFKNQ